MARKSILLVEADPDVSTLLPVVLESEGYAVAISTSLDKAVELASKSRFDLIIVAAFRQIDILRLDPTFLKRLRAVARATPLMLFSASVAPVRKHTGQFDVDEVLPKPFEIDDLVEKVNRLLRD